jgi:hypothetical protein
VSAFHGNQFAAAGRALRSIEGADAQFSASGSAVPLSLDFPWQSGPLFSTAAGQQNSGALPQLPTSDNINPTTKIVQQIQGYGFALSPNSETPIAVLPDSIKGSSNGAAVILAPGQTYIPGGQFRSFSWGLPYGWLGGGLAPLLVLREEKGFIQWASVAPEVIFHRVTVPINLTTDVVAALPNPNWPVRFPWPALYSTFSGGSNSSIQKPQITITPTRFVCRLVSNANGGVPTIPQGVDIRLVLVQSRDADQQIIAATPNTNDANNPGATPAYGALVGATAAATTARGSAIDIAFQSFGASGFKIGGVAIAEAPVVSVSADLLRYGGDNAVLLAIDKNNLLTSGAYALEITRYGKIGG